MQYHDLAGKIALVTGVSRGQGIGAAICRHLAAQGCHIFFSSWRAFDDAQGYADPVGPDELVTGLRAQGVQADQLAIDLSEQDAPRRLLDAATNALGQPTILVNNAAYGVEDGYQALDAATLDAHYAVNVRAMALLSVEVARRHPQGQAGRIINLTSGQGLGAMPGELAYAATKGAVDAFTRTLAHEVAHLGITVNAVDPGSTDTGWMSDEVKAQEAARMATGRVGVPDDAARLVTFLASAEAAWITGQIMHSRGA